MKYWRKKESKKRRRRIKNMGNEKAAQVVREAKIVFKLNILLLILTKLAPSPLSSS